MRRPSDGECLDVKGSFLKPGGVVGDENEHAETDLVDLSQSAAGNHDDGDRKNCNFTNKSLRHLPTVGANCRGPKTDSRKGVGMERQDLSYGEGVHTGFASSDPSRWK